MSKVWYCQINGREYGPFDSSKLRALANEKKIRPEHLVRQSPADPWVPANRVTGLFPPVNAAPLATERLWRIKTPSKQIDGVTDNQLKQLARSGQLKPEHELCLEGKEQWFKASTVKRLFPSIPKSSPMPDVITAEIVSPKGKPEEPVEIQKPEATATPGERITFAGVKKFIGSLLPSGDRTASVDQRPPKNSIQFFGPGTVVNLGYGPLANPLVYATGGKFDQLRDSSLIELGLVVAKQSDTSERLGYWPSYHNCNPGQRAAYLQWLYGGRSHQMAELGYVFIFFYGLERRIVVDGKDHECVARELIRLLPMFGQSNSFAGYATRLLWLAIYLSVDCGGMPIDVIADAIRVTNRWRDGSLELYLAYLSRTQGKLNGEACYAWAEQDQRAMRSIVCIRHSDKFKELFIRKVQDAFPEGVPFPSSIRNKAISYHPASSTLLSAPQQMVKITGQMMPTMEPRRNPCSKLIQIWNDCIEQLKAFDRASRKATSEITSETYEALPIELRDGDHPELEYWNRLISRVTDEDGWAVVNVNELARIKGIRERTSLTKSQTLSILKTADALGFAIEPDCRINGKNFRWNEPIAIFNCELAICDDRSIEKFRMAAFLLELGLSVAVSDNEVDERELEAIESHIEAELDLTPDLAKRLSALRHLMVAKGPKLSTVPQTFFTALSKNQRKAIGSYLVSVAAADQVVTNKEKNVLRAAFQKLSLPLDLLTELLAPYEAVEAKAQQTPATLVVDKPDTEAPVLDFDRIRRIREETRHVQDLLHEVITNSFDGSDESLVVRNADASEEPIEEFVSATAVIATDQTSQMVDQCVDNRFSTVPSRYQAFCSKLATQNRWNLREAQELARSEGLMFSAALETINEWSTDTFGDWLIEEADTDLIVHLTLLESR
jgi:uncharacterized tellurite resistance protein B-like protein